MVGATPGVGPGERLTIEVGEAVAIAAGDRMEATGEGDGVLAGGEVGAGLSIGVGVGGLEQAARTSRQVNAATMSKIISRNDILKCVTMMVRSS
jgi:hypothetical protein